MERELVRAILRKESPIAIVGDDAEARLDLIDSVSSLLIEGGARVIRVSSPDGSPLDTAHPWHEKSLRADRVGPISLPRIELVSNRLGEDLS